MPLFSALPIDIRLIVYQYFELHCRDDTWTTSSASRPAIRRFDGLTLFNLFQADPSLWTDLDLLNTIVLRGYIKYENACIPTYPALIAIRKVLESPALHPKIATDVRKWGTFGIRTLLEKVQSKPSK
ncbi:hypothetical protein CLAFUW4_05518 [Fulvia fulva]|uniref:Uncharacterized protein n=1 Tax=Passalora fulva TaxID=5499 RepID=A0A9Q8LHW6_PASFU|nr:uncharacterized protein CLAFUR5_05659 [Fulvia fulva]KAK4623631.1 hypothetical protein CLAFUR4_05512 [Fulvia fulva]KAK4625046.1 hypothetical protein CLAFUR0_05520 [Fulvia fulva]UJO17712.1 hypothetical protein CLAFUR5_05659 [Fulvia fulva]WPV14760.1 hypothetical protein CLAFUW4_05518 [Fulvia fulva]WPV30228.1 hypothetical protein CLAFUW7_05516 [Fulvia fulva]